MPLPRSVVLRAFSTAASTTRSSAESSGPASGCDRSFMLERRGFYQQGGFMKSVLITGCSSGFGMLAAVTAAKSGFRVFATMRNLGKRQRLDAALAKAGVTAEVVALDVTGADSIEAAVRAVL